MTQHPGEHTSGQPDPELRLRIIGGGPERQRLESLAAELRIDERVEFTGSVAPSEVPQLLAGLDIATAPYPLPDAGAEHYFSPLKVYEYLAAGLPVVASAVGELPQLLQGGPETPALPVTRGEASTQGQPLGARETVAPGLTVPPGDIELLAQALWRLSHDPAQRARMGAAGRRLVEDEHSWVQRALSVLEQVPVWKAAQR